MRYLVFDSSTGEVTKILECPETDVELNVEGAESYLSVDDFPGVDPSNSYVAWSGVEYEVHEKDLLNTLVEIDGLVVRMPNIASGSKLVITDDPFAGDGFAMGEHVVADSSGVEIEFDAPGTYEVRIYPPPQYRDEVLEVTVG